MDIQLSFAMERNPRNRAIFDHEVKPEGIEFTCTRIGPSELFWRQLRFAEFDVSEMSLSSLLIALANGDDRYIGLPIFTTRRFFQSSILVHRDSGIDRPEDLKGRKIGVPEFQQTAAVWVRGILKDDFGVEQTEIEWFMERLPEHSHGGATGFTAPPGTIVNFIPPDKSIGSMILDREIDGTLLWFGARGGQDLIDRTAIDLPNHPDVKYLFDPPRSEGRRYYAKHQLMPINHAMVIRRLLAEKVTATNLIPGGHLDGAAAKWGRHGCIEVHGYSPLCLARPRVIPQGHPVLLALRGFVWVSDGARSWA